MLTVFLHRLWGASSSATAASVLASGSITISGSDAHGIYSQTTGLGNSNATVSGTSAIVVNGANADGIRTEINQAAASYAVAINDTATITSGTGTAAGIRTISVAGSSGTISIGVNTTIDASASSTGVVDSGGAIVDDVDDTTVDVAGMVTGDIELGGGSDIANITSGVNTSGISLIDGGADGSVSSDALTFQSISFTGGDTIINWETFSLQGSGFKLDSDLTMGDSGVGGTVNIDGTSSVSFTGNSPGIFAIVGDVNHIGLLTAQDPDTDDSLTITGNHTGNGGTLALDSELNNEITDITDILMINGDTSGSTTVNITNIGGTGAKTGTGPTDGILVIEVDGTSNGDFVLAGGTVQDGDFSYILIKADSQNWYLQSTFSPLTVEVIPTLTQCGTAALAMLMLVGGLFGRRRKQG